jgi:hypothetical protein
MYKKKAIEAERRLIKTCKETNSIRKTVKLWGTSRFVVKKWISSAG